MAFGWLDAITDIVSQCWFKVGQASATAGPTLNQHRVLSSCFLSPSCRLGVGVARGG